ncbi:thioesterase-like superfamily-domain-containing protein [Tirmania nivea]|nr:thioesterase-like superfamily-domain-containing protein [Tirmania nivea]
MPRDSEELCPPTVKGEENIDPASSSSDLSTTSTSSLPPQLSKPTSTLYPLPLYLSSFSLIERYLHLTPLTPTTFTNTNALWQTPGARGIYGGEIIGQSIVAAASTIPENFWLHSIHAYFVLAGDARVPITYEVVNIRTGRSFATRQVKALQRGEVIFVIMASFQKPVAEARRQSGSVAEWQVEMPDVPKPNEVLSEEEKLKKGEELCTNLRSTIAYKKSKNPEDPTIPTDEQTLSTASTAVIHRKYRLDKDPFEWRKLQPSTYPPSQPYSERKVRFWVRTRKPLLPQAMSGIPHVQLAALAYFTDNWFIGTVRRVNDAAGRKNLKMLVSLDHTVYFHLGKETRVDGREEDKDGEWLLVEMDAQWVGEERGVVTQRVWRGGDGRLVATCVQEGLVRLREGAVRVGERGEEGAVVRSKL